jgi:hypothetical protein
VSAELLIPLIVFIALFAVFALLLRRAWGLILQTRQLATFRRTVRDLAARIDEVLAAITVQVDRVRRRQVDAATITQGIDTALESLLGLSAEARNLAGPDVTTAARGAFIAEIDRAERALQMVEHGCAILSTVGAGHRQIEAETAIKRGYLNVVHAREAIQRHAADIDAARPQDELRWLTRRRGPEKID